MKQTDMVRAMNSERRQYIDRINQLEGQLKSNQLIETFFCHALTGACANPGIKDETGEVNPNLAAQFAFVAAQAMLYRIQLDGAEKTETGPEPEVRRDGFASTDMPIQKVATFGPVSLHPEEESQLIL